MNPLTATTLIAAMFGSLAFSRADETGVATLLESLGGTIRKEEGQIREVYFQKSSELKDKEWRAIGSLEGLKKLTVYGQAHGLNDETVDHLTGLSQLTHLSTDGAQLSDEGLARLAALKSLESVSFFHLSFRMEGFTGKGFTAWKDLPNIRQLTVAGMSMGDEGFEAIAKIKNLETLRTWHTYQTDAANRSIASLPHLKHLKLWQRLPNAQTPPSLSPSSIPTLAGIQSLEVLEIGEARFSFEDLKPLANLSNLKQLKIDRTEIQESDIDQLRRALPEVEVVFNPLTDEQKKQLEEYIGTK